MKKKILLILSLGFLLSACQNDDYQSQRHPEESKKSQVENNVQYTKKDKSNDLSDRKLKNENKNDKNLSNLENTENIDSASTEDIEENIENIENIEGSFTVENITNIREYTTTESEIVAKLQPGNIVYRTEVDGEWSKVEFDSYEGYILTELLVPAY